MWFRKLFRRRSSAKADESWRTEEEIRRADEGFLDEPPVGKHGEPGIPRIEPLPEPIDLPPVPGEREK